MYAVIARVPITDMLIAGLLPAGVMVVCLLAVSLQRRRRLPNTTDTPLPRPAPAPQAASLRACAWAAKWELLAPVVAIVSLVSGLATPTESAALTATYAIATQALAHRELSWALLGRSLAECTRLFGGVMLILGMALALTNYLVDAGIPDLAVDQVRSLIPNR
ncbi:MAG: C4-dicarboxylate ABC transporter permease, partial [Burkholderiales bacterium PBB5]